MKNDDGTTSTETKTETEEYTVNVHYTDLSTVYSNISSVFGIEITQENIANANEIYYRMKYGDGVGANGSFNGLNTIPLSDEPFVGIDGFVVPVAGDWQSMAQVNSVRGTMPLIHFILVLILDME